MLSYSSGPIAGPTVVLYFHNDHLGTPWMLTDATQAVVWAAQYRPFGEASVTGSVTQPLRFPGQYADAETGLHYNYFRDYEPGTGRYIESDPIGLAGGINTYAYVSADPINKTDPTGLATETLLGTCVVGGPVNPACDAAVVINVCKWLIVGGVSLMLTGSTPQCDGDDDNSQCRGDDGDCKRKYTECLMSGLGGSVGYGSACQACFDQCRGTGSWPDEVTSAVFGDGLRVSCRYWEI